MIYTVFPKDESYMPHDCATYEEAVAYGEELDCEYDITETKGEVV